MRLRTPKERRCESHPRRRGYIQVATPLRSCPQLSLHWEASRAAVCHPELTAHLAPHLCTELSKQRRVGRACGWLDLRQRDPHRARHVHVRGWHRVKLVRLRREMVANQYTAGEDWMVEVAPHASAGEGFGLSEVVIIVYLDCFYEVGPRNHKLEPRCEVTAFDCRGDDTDFL
eukprot:1910171-Pleurochrysis_carterae.AAC.3